MSDNRHKEKREFVRTPFTIRASLKRIDASELERRQELKDRFVSSRTTAFPGMGDEEPPPHESHLSELATALYGINEKLDRIIQLLGGDRIQDEPIRVNETLNISGSGVSILLTEKVEIGQLVDVSLHIPDFPMGILNAQGEVIRSTPRPGGLYEVGIKFAPLMEDERDRLISFIFRQQRKTIRDTKSFS